MFDRNMNQVSAEFLRCWKSAERHLRIYSRGSTLHWLKNTITPPFLDHLSFQIGNQLFYVRIEDFDKKMTSPGSQENVNVIADACNGHACFMPMRLVYGEWVPTEKEWGLIDANFHKPLNPLSVISDEKIVMTDWELHDRAVQIVKNHIYRKMKCEITSYEGGPSELPSIWFAGKNGYEWVVVRAIRNFNDEVSFPLNIRKTVDKYSELGAVGHYAYVSFKPKNFGRSDDKIIQVSLCRGVEIEYKFSGLISATIH